MKVEVNNNPVLFKATHFFPKKTSIFCNELVTIMVLNFTR